MRKTHFCIWIIDIAATTAAFTCFNTKKIKYRLITININNFLSYILNYTLKTHFNGVAFSRAVFNGFTPDKNVNPVKNAFLVNPNILLYYVILFY